MFSCFFLLDRRRCSLSTVAVHLVGFPANAFASECIFLHEKACRVRFVLARSSTVINPRTTKLFTVTNLLKGGGCHSDPPYIFQVVAHKRSSFGIEAALG